MVGVWFKSHFAYIHVEYIFCKLILYALLIKTFLYKLLIKRVQKTDNIFDNKDQNVTHTCIHLMFVCLNLTFDYLGKTDSLLSNELKQKVILSYIWDDDFKKTSNKKGRSPTWAKLICK